MFIIKKLIMRIAEAEPVLVIILSIIDKIKRIVTFITSPESSKKRLKPIRFSVKLTTERF